MYKRKVITKEIETHTDADINYILLTTEISIDGVTETTYGIGAVRNGVVIKSVPDVSLERDKVEAVVALCNKEKLELCHLNAVAEDTAI